MTSRNAINTDLLYWAAILSACTMGETAGDFVSFGLKFGYGGASIALGALLVLALVAEAIAKTPNEIRYWTTIVIMSTTGTALADLLTRTLKLGYGWGSLLLTGLFVLIYIIGRFTQKQKKSIHTEAHVLPHVEINTPVKGLPETDALYWAAILVASTFGTTMGDFVSNVLHFGFAGGSVFLGTLLAVVLLFEFRAQLPNKPRYWSALVICSTIGATTGDFLTKPDALNLGYAISMAILVGVFIIIFMTRYYCGKPIAMQSAITGESVLPHVEID